MRYRDRGYLSSGTQARAANATAASWTKLNPAPVCLHNWLSCKITSHTGGTAPYSTHDTAASQARAQEDSPQDEIMQQTKVRASARARPRAEVEGAHPRRALRSR